MKHSKENIIKLLAAMWENEHELAKLEADEGNSEHYRIHINKATELTTVMKLLTRKDFFMDLCEIYNVRPTE